MLLIPNEMPDDLKTILEMGIPGARFKKASELTEEDKKALSVDEKSILYAQAMKEKVGVEGMKDLAALSQVLKSPAAVATLGVSGLCPQGVHCAHHCSCLFKVSRSGEVAGEIDLLKAVILAEFILLLTELFILTVRVPFR